MAEGPVVIDAPKTMRDLLRQEENRCLSHGISCELRTPREPTDTTKAMVGLHAGMVLRSLTIWSLGTIEFIAFNTQTKKELVVRDMVIPGRR
jgi:hypothetical protein